MEELRTSWKCYPSDYYSWELILWATAVVLKEFWDLGKNPNVSECSLDQFLHGEMHGQISDAMGSGILAEAVQNANIISSTLKPPQI